MTLCVLFSSYNNSKIKNLEGRTIMTNEAKNRRQKLILNPSFTFDFYVGKNNRLTYMITSFLVVKEDFGYCWADLTELSQMLNYRTGNV